MADSQTWSYTSCSSLPLRFCLLSASRAASVWKDLVAYLTFYLSSCMTLPVLCLLVEDVKKQFTFDPMWFLLFNMLPVQSKVCYNILNGQIHEIVKVLYEFMQIEAKRKMETLSWKPHISLKRQWKSSLMNDSKSERCSKKQQGYQKRL